jgi:hypothetical protein
VNAEQQLVLSELSDGQLLDSHDLSLRLRAPRAWCRDRLDELHRAGALDKDTTLSLPRFRKRQKRP